MRCTSLLRANLFVAACILLCARPNFARRQQPPAPKIVIDQIKFVPVTHLPTKQLEEFMNREKQLEFDSYSDWTQEIEQQVRDLWQRNGFFRVNAHAMPVLISTDSGTQHYLVTIRVDEGAQYRLGSIHLEHAAEERTLTAFVFPPQTLRDAFQMKDGDIFDGEKARKGIEALSRLYGSKGYIEFTAVPTYDYGSSDQKIVVTIAITESKQFRVERVEVVGLEPTLARILQASIKLDEPMNTQALNAFFDKYSTDLPPGAKLYNTVQINRNEARGTATLFFDFTRRAGSN
jgi:outer membrane protein assembly factor BamA